MPISSFLHWWEQLPGNERELIDVLRSIITETLPPQCRERFAWNVPCYYGYRQICILWPASVPRSGIKQGVLLGFSQGRLLYDPCKLLTSGTNKKIFYHIYRSVDDIALTQLHALLENAAAIDEALRSQLIKTYRGQ